MQNKTVNYVQNLTRAVGVAFWLLLLTAVAINTILVKSFTEAELTRLSALLLIAFTAVAYGWLWLKKRQREVTEGEESKTFIFIADPPETPKACVECSSRIHWDAELAELLTNYGETAAEE